MGTSKLIGADVGGTFTDLVAVTDQGIKTVKVTTSRGATAHSVLEGSKEIEVGDASVFNHASTRGLNAVVTRQLPKVAFLTTLGHRDILDQGRVWRPAKALTDPHWRRPFGDAASPLVPRYLRRGIRERVMADGGVLLQLDEEQARSELDVLRRCNVEGVAICLLNSYVNHDHEERLRELVRQELPDVHVSISSEISPLAKEYNRASTTVIDVFMQKIYGEYTRALGKGLNDLGFSGTLNYANCAAQLLPAEPAMERPFELVFSGPAAGTMASAHFGSHFGLENLLCADVGGTSCDISLVTGGQVLVDTTFELEHDLVVNALSNEVSSIGAGGGSLVSISPAGELEVGPGSAGADPGPACYGRGGATPTMTDACLLMGVLNPSTFAGGRINLDTKLSEQAFGDLRTVLPFGQRVSYAFNVGINNIAEGITNIAVKHGVDPRDYSLLAYGAAGPMLLPAALDKVHAAEVIVPPHPGLFSALGLLSSDHVYAHSRSAYIMLTHDSADHIDGVYQQMEEHLRVQLGGVGNRVRYRRSFDGRLLGQSWETPFVQVPTGTIDTGAVESMVGNFHSVYEERSGNKFEELPVQGVTFRVEAVVESEKVDLSLAQRRTSGTLAPERRVDIYYLEDQPVSASEYDRDKLQAGDEIQGPAVIRESAATTLIVRGQVAAVGAYGELRIRSTK